MLLRKLHVCTARASKLCVHVICKVPHANGVVLGAADNLKGVKLNPEHAILVARQLLHAFASMQVPHPNRPVSQQVCTHTHTHTDKRESE